MNIIELYEILNTVNETNALYGEAKGEYYNLNKTAGELKVQIKDAKKDRVVAIQIKNKSYGLAYMQTFGSISVLRSTSESQSQDSYLIPTGKVVDFEELLKKQD